MPLTVTVQEKGLTLPLLLWSAHGRAGTGAGLRQAALALNPGLARLGPEIPLLTRVVLPDLPRPATTRAVVSLFD